ncbi:MAG: HD domain-containing protein [Gemmatimonadota bacterium]
MSGADSTEKDLDGLTPIEFAAARGALPEWSHAGSKRRKHMARVAGLLERWARDLDLPESEVLRWAAAGWLHDSLRDADPEALIDLVAPAERDLPGALLHGPAAAARLAGDVDPRVQNAVRYHTIGHPDLDRLGRAVFLADFLEPGRKAQRKWREGLRQRMPHEFDDVLVEVAAVRITETIDRRKPLRADTAAFWSAVVGADEST